jgi:hypothetical protein
MKGRKGLTSILQITVPECQIVPQQLHNECRILVRFFREGIKFSNGIIECLLGELARLVWAVQDLVVEHGKVEGESKTDGMGRWDLGDGDLPGIFVRCERLVSAVLAQIARGDFGEVAMIISFPDERSSGVRGTRADHLHLVVEYL